MTETMQDAQSLWAAVADGDSDTARAIVLAQLDAGISGSSIIVQQLVPAQRSVGERWQQAAWSVADEHAATAVIDAALSVIEHNTVPVERNSRGLLLVTCAESEWHMLPARLAAQLIRENRFTVRILGPSLPADHLREYLVRVKPDAVVLSATMATSLPGAARSIAAAHDVGVPVVAGGAAFGSDDRRAALLGADLWLDDARELTLPVSSVSARDTQPAWDSYLDLHDRSAATVAAAFIQLSARLPAMHTMTLAQLTHTRTDLTHILDFLAVAVFLDDVEVMGDFDTWLCSLLEARGVSRAMLTTSYDVLASQLEDRPRSMLRELVERGTAA